METGAGYGIGGGLALITTIILIRPKETGVEGGTPERPGRERGRR